MKNGFVCILLTLCLVAALAPRAAAKDDYVQLPDGTERKVIHLGVWSLPRPEGTGVGAKSQRAILARFKEKYPWIRLYSPTGISIPEMSGGDTRALMAIAGGVSPDVIYVNFRQCETYIREGFLYPLDEWWEKIPESERNERLIPQTRNVVYRYGPGRTTGKDTNKHYWALPYGTLFKGLIWRKDLFQQVGLDPERGPKDWDEFCRYARQCTNPQEGTFGLMWGKGVTWSWYFFSILNSAGARAMKDFGDEDWHVTFDTPEAVTAYEFMLKLVQGKFRKPDGQIVEGVVCRDTAEGSRLWTQGRIGMRETYLRDDMLVDINPDLVGLGPTPMGPSGNRGAEINCTMSGIFSGAAKKGPEVLEAAWLYVYFTGSPEAMEIKTRVMVENGYGLFANPLYLERLGYDDYLRRVPKSWRETFAEARRTGEPEPYGRNTQMVYNYMTDPADKLVLDDVGNWVWDAVERKREELKEANPRISKAEMDRELAKVRAETEEKVRHRIQDELTAAVEKAEQKMIGIIPPKELRKRRIIAGIVAVVVLGAFVLLFRHVIKAFTPEGAKGSWMFRKYWLAYLLLIPAVGSIALWRYYPLIRGAVMAFQDYHIVLPTTWVGLDNFAQVLWDSYFWNALFTSVKYAALSLLMGFFAPIILAILLHEIPKGKVLFRTIYYLPAVVSGLVVMIMWKNFFEPSDRGLLNQVIGGISPTGFTVIGVVLTFLLALGSYFNFKNERRVAGPVMGVFAVLTAVLFFFIVLKVRSLPGAHLPSQRWLEDPNWALFCVILPTVWAGMGPGCLIYLAALKTIPEDFYEAADIDGAGFFGKIRHITLPTIKVLIIIQFVGAFVAAFRTAGYILVMTGGGPNRTTEVTALKIFYDAFVYLRFGIATATAWLLGFLLIGFTVFQLKRLSKVEFKTAG